MPSDDSRIVIAIAKLHANSRSGGGSNVGRITALHGVGSFA
ncbi:hypothetical protein ACFWEH_38040 [Streptomyces anulatus]